MDRQWMYNSDRRSKAFIDGVHEFLEAAQRHKMSGFISCPCKVCKNELGYSSTSTIHFDLLQKGFMPNYIYWTKHGEKGIIQEDDDEEEESMPDFAQFIDIVMGEVEEALVQDDGQDDDDLARMIRDEKNESENERDKKKLQRMLEDHRTSLYLDCKEGLKKLRTTLELLQWKAGNGVSDKGFNELLELIKKMLPDGNTLPKTTYEAKEIVCPLGLEVQKIHACPNDCILYRRKYEHLDACPVCKA